VEGVIELEVRRVEGRGAIIRQPPGDLSQAVRRGSPDGKVGVIDVEASHVQI
jgi:hypothetical protein